MILNKCLIKANLVDRATSTSRQALRFPRMIASRETMALAIRLVVSIQLRRIITSKVALILINLSLIEKLALKNFPHLRGLIL